MDQKYCLVASVYGLKPLPTDTKGIMQRLVDWTRSRTSWKIPTNM